MRSPVYRLPIRMAALLLPLAAAASGCSDPNSFAPNCPQGTVRPDAADITRYRPGGGRDVTDLVLSGRIVKGDGHCSPAKDSGHIRANVAVSMTLTRGPAAVGRNVDVMYFVAVPRGQNILDKVVVPVHGTFPPNIDELHITGDPIDMTIPTPRGVSGPDYTVITGFQLTPQELAANRARLPQR